MTEPNPWKAEADTLRRIVLEALAQFEQDNPSFIVLPADHWTKRARQLFGID